MSDPALIRDPIIEAAARAKEATISRFFAKVEPEPMSGCWFWTGGTVPSRYGAPPRGSFWMGGVHILAHRASFLLFKGEIPSGLFVCHKCDIPICVNPDHLFIGSHRDNMGDMVHKGRTFSKRHPEQAREKAYRLGKQNRHARGERHPQAKLSLVEVAAIKIDPRPTRLLAAQYHVNRTTIQKIRRGATWKQEASE